MKNAVIIIIFLINIKNVYSQTNFGKEWCIGLYGYRVKFATPIIHDTFFILKEFIRGKSNICDSNGNILLMSDGFNIYDSNGFLIDQGDTLVPKDYYNFNDASMYSQSSIFLPMANKKYYFITPTASDTQLNNWLANGLKAPFNLLLCNEIDMNANGGAGKVTKRMVPLLENKELNKCNMMACRHANGKDWWLLKLAGDSNMIYTFLFTQDSVYNKGIQYIPFPFRGYLDLWGQMMFSPDGTKWASTYSNNSGDVYLADFDRCTGLLSNIQMKTIWPQPTGFPVGDVQADTTNAGLCFSPNGKFLYVSRYSHIIQFNTVNSGQYKVWGMDTSYNSFAGFNCMYLGGDNKIYIGHKDGISRQMSVIDNPDVEGAACNFCRKCLRSTSVDGYLSSPPCMPNYELGAELPCWPLGSGELTIDNGQLEVYPNPTSGKFQVKGKIANSKKELYNLLGVLLYATIKEEIDVSHLAKGVYIIKCEGQSKKVIIE